MRAHSGRTGRFRRWLANPIASAVLLALLAADALTLPREWRNASVVGGLVRDGAVWAQAGTRPTGERPAEGFFVVRDGQGLRFIDPGAESWDGLSAALMDEGAAVAECAFQESVYGSGFWAFTAEHRARRLLILPLSGEWPEARLVDARAAVFGESTAPAWLRERSQGWSDIADADSVTSRPRWGGIAHDALVLAAFGGLLYSFTGWRAWCAARPWSRAARRVRRGACASCGYDLGGSLFGVCPECGARRL